MMVTSGLLSTRFLIFLVCNNSTSAFSGIIRPGVHSSLILLSRMRRITWTKLDMLLPQSSRRTRTIIWQRHGGDGRKTGGKPRFPLFWQLLLTGRPSLLGGGSLNLFIMVTAVFLIIHQRSPGWRWRLHDSFSTCPSWNARTNGRIYWWTDPSYWRKRRYSLYPWTSPPDIHGYLGIILGDRLFPGNRHSDDCPFGCTAPGANSFCWSRMLSLHLRTSAAYLLSWTVVDLGTSVQLLVCKTKMGWRARSWYIPHFPLGW